VSEPLVPLIVRFELPAGVVAAVVIVKVELPPAVTEVGLNKAVAPAGKPLSEKPTVPVNPPSAVVLTV